MSQLKFLLVLSSLAIIGCNKDEESDSFNRKIMLEQHYDNIISPSVNLFHTELGDLKNYTDVFVAEPVAVNLENLQEKFLSAYKAYQGLKILNFGPIENSLYCKTANIYPTSTEDITQNILSGDYDLETASNVDAIGFPAIDYLLYFDGDASVLKSFSDDEYAGPRKLYLQTVVNKLWNDYKVLQTKLTNYRNEFVNSTGVDVGSSTGIMFNAYMKDLELLKNAKIGIPSGQQTGGLTRPAYVEAYFSGASRELAIESCKRLQNFFNGADGIGLDDYVRDVEGDNGKESLADVINTQFDVVINKLNQFGDPLSREIDNNSAAFNELYLETKKLVTYLKTDVSSLLGILITYQDNDGD